MERVDFARILKWPVTAAAALGCLYLVALIYRSGEPVWAVAALALFSLAFYIYLGRANAAYRYLFPGLAGIAVFVVFPILYTLQIGFTNFSSANLLSFERATAYLLERTQPIEGRSYQFTVHHDGSAFRLRFVPKTDEEATTPEARAEIDAQTYVTPSLALIAPTPPEEIVAVRLRDADVALGEPLPMTDVIKRRDVLSKLRIRLPDGALVTYAGVRDFAPQESIYRRGGAAGELIAARTGTVYKANFVTGFYESPQGEQLQPGFKVNIGIGNYLRMVDDPEFRGPFVQIFLWTVTFAGLTVLLTLAVGCTLAVLLNWEALQFRTVYRTLLFLPYAVPGFISILIFRGLFNQNLGEINLALSTLFGIKPAWFADPFLAKVMILIVNTWLGYPYVMVLCTGLIKAIPADLYEASAIAGAGPLSNFSKITAPLILKPLLPLLIASFAFNFNNFMLIELLTGGRPDFLNTRVPAGTTDLLVTYTYRIAFQDSGQRFGLAAAISTAIFVLVALLSFANLRMLRVNRPEAR